MSGTVLGAPGSSNSGKKKSGGQQTTPSTRESGQPITSISKENDTSQFTPANTPISMPMFNIGVAPKHDDDEDFEPRKGKKKSGAQQQEPIADSFIMNAIKEKLEGIEVPALPLVLKRRIKALKNLNDQHLALEKKYFDEVRELEAKYFTLYSPLYAKRREIVIGVYEPTDEEVGKLEEEPKPDDKNPTENKPETKKEENEGDIMGIPDFWLNALRTGPTVGDTITENDEDALRYLQDIQCENFTNGEDPSKHGFKLHFHFNDNPYFLNKALTKVYHLTFENGAEVLESSDGTEIQWKAGKNLTVKTVKKKQRHKAGRATRTVTKQEPCDSFFNFFKPPSVPEKGTEMEKNEYLSLEFDLESDYDIGSVIKEKVIPHAILYFTGEAEEDEEFEDLEEDDEDEELEDIEEEDEEDEVPTRARKLLKSGDNKRGNTAGTSTTSGGEKPPECKQQ